jgi:hypothetical protein
VDAKKAEADENVDEVESDLYNMEKLDEYLAATRPKHIECEDMWAQRTTTNSLKDTHAFYCSQSKAELKKDTRKIFESGTIDDIRNDIQVRIIFELFVINCRI